VVKGDVLQGTLPWHWVPSFSELLVDVGPLGGGEDPTEWGDLSEVLAVDAGIEHAGGDLVDRPLQDSLPFVQERRGVRIDGPHVGDVSSGDLDASGSTRSQFLRNGGMEKQASRLIAS